MRTIKFRGKAYSSGEWVYGYYFYDTLLKSHWIGYGDDISEVDPETVGQFTGLFDKNGKEIYEGDIYKRILDKKNIYKKEYEWADYWLVSWIVDDCCFTTTCIADNDNGKYIKISNWASKQNQYSKRFKEFDEYIGNIFDNPELLKN